MYPHRVTLRLSRIMQLHDSVPVCPKHILCVDGGLSPILRKLNCIRLIQGHQEFTVMGYDFEETDVLSSRGAGILFGHIDTAYTQFECMNHLNLNRLVRRNLVLSINTANLCISVIDAKRTLL
nr:AlNc14C68G4777 [Albugo laibachii Nc14]|eukprot:CCA19333.1 AlNc14C68G4777 [Albugo laibachii Nc14]